MTAKPDDAPRELTMTRVLDAPRTLVWEVWTNPTHAARWWGPKDFTNPVYESDLRPGGKMRIHMRAPDGTIFPMSGVYEEVVVPERIVLFGPAEMDGAVIFDARTTVTFEEHEGKTTLTVHQAYLNVTPAAAPALAGATIGWTQSLDRLAAYLSSLEAQERNP
jgi:uncharacterized protein YndB with AHSA1/START domain